MFSSVKKRYDSKSKKGKRQKSNLKDHLGENEEQLNTELMTSTPANNLIGFNSNDIRLQPIQEHDFNAINIELINGNFVSILIFIL